MKPANLTVLQLFEKQQRYVVPLFQRQYIWSIDKQWKPLWEDISFKAHEILEQKIGQHKEINNHFLGAIVLTPIKTQGNEMWAKSLIDGQQRLTTLQIVLIALRDYATFIKYEKLLESLNLHILNIGVKELEIEKYKVWPTKADQEIFENIFNSGSLESVDRLYPVLYRKGHRSPEPLPQLVGAYKYFYSSIDEFVKDDMENGIPWPLNVNKPTQDEKVYAIYTAFKNHLEIVTIDLDETDNPQMIFETLNFRGEPLKPSDLIRNYVFLDANQQRLTSESLYKKYWYDFDRPAPNGNSGFWKLEENVGRNKVQHLDLFIYHYLSYVSEKEILMSRTYPEFKEWWQVKEGAFEEELNKLVEFSKVFKQFYQPDLTTRTGIFLRRLLMFDVSTIYPLLLYIFGERKDLTKNEKEQWVQSLESYLVRRVVCNLTAKNYNNVFRVLLDNLRKQDNPNINFLNNSLMESEKDSIKWPTDEEFEQGWLSKDAYSRRGAKVVLEALDLQMMTSKQEEVHISSPTTIEHVLPRGWGEKNWPLPLGKEDESRESKIIYRNNILQTYGNLTLLTQALNSSTSNGPFKDKKPKITEQSLLKMNSYFQNCGDYWNEAEIIKRGKELFKIAKVIWPHP